MANHEFTEIWESRTFEFGPEFECELEFEFEFEFEFELQIQ